MNGEELLVDQVSHRRRLSCRAQTPNPHQVLDRGEKRVMVVLLRAGHVAFPWRDHEREHAIVGTAVVLIPCDEENPAVLPRLRGRDLSHLSPQPAVPYGYGAVMRVMAHVWRDPG